MSAGVDFETKIFVKHEAAKLLEKELSSPSWKPKVFMLSGVTDCYQPIEKDLRITRACLEVLQDFRNPASIVTKNYLVTRDVDFFEKMHEWNGISVHMSITTLDGKLARLMEPRASQPLMRFRAIEALAKRGIPTSMIIGPVLPGLTDHEIPALLKSASDAGAQSAHYTLLRLPYGVKDLFETWLHEHYPDRAERVLNHVRDTRGGKLYDAKFGDRMRGKGVYADNIAHLFKLYKQKYGLTQKSYSNLSTEHFRRNARSPQGDLFDL
jgi:DNA repair photolyase